MQVESKQKLIKQNIKPGLYIVSTPIGNLEDITIRSINILKKSEYILCEDTRVSSNLLRKYEINSKLISNHKFNEKKNLTNILSNLKKGLTISMISDAGTPVIADPGQILIKECIKNDINVFPVPGPSAATSAISVSGFKDKYLFYGFLPNSDSEIVTELKKLRQIPYSIIFFISPKKINKILKYLKITFKDRKILVAREMTKLYEEYIHGNLENFNIFTKEPKGEITVVISNTLDEKIIPNILNEDIKKEINGMLKKYSNKDVVNFISKKEDISKKLVYNYCLKQKK